MKQTQSRRRGRGRPNNARKSNGSGRSGPGNRPEAKVRGNAKQQLERYKNMARDANQAGDPVQAEYYYQHVDHYFRIINEKAEAASSNQPNKQSPDQSNGRSDSTPENQMKTNDAQPAQPSTEATGASPAEIARAVEIRDQPDTGDHAPNKGKKVSGNSTKDSGRTKKMQAKPDGASADATPATKKTPSKDAKTDQESTPEAPSEPAATAPK